jgi:hypothetical protein
MVLTLWSRDECQRQVMSWVAPPDLEPACRKHPIALDYFLLIPIVRGEINHRNVYPPIPELQSRLTK